MIINFCDKSGKEKEYNCVQFIKRGCQGAVYRLDDGRCLKYFISKYISSSIEEDTFRKISEMELANFYKIYEMLYNKIDLENKFSGYVMEYYKKDKGFDILSMPVDYTLENFFAIYESVNRLTEEGIYAADMHCDNVIANNSGVTVIDVDLYCLGYYLKGLKLKERNDLAVYCLFRGLYYEALLKYFSLYEMNDKRQVVKDLFLAETGTSEVVKKLSRYRKPIDYIRDNVR